MEAAITNLTCLGDRGLVIAHGKFGNRFKEIASAKGRVVHALEVTDETWGTAFSHGAIGRALSDDAKRVERDNLQRFTFLTLQLNETSTGVAYSQKQLTAIIKKARAYNPDILIFLDGVSGIFAHHIDIATLDIDVIVVGSQKGLGVSSGITYSSVSKRALGVLLCHAGYTQSLTALRRDKNQSEYISRFERKQRVSYLNYLRLLTTEHPARLDTPSIFHILATDRALACINTTGKEETVERCIRFAQKARKKAATLGLNLLSDASFRSNSVTPILLPHTMTAPSVRTAMEKQYGILVSGAQSEYWKPTLIRIGHLGFVSDEDTTRCLRALEIILREGTV